MSIKKLLNKWDYDVSILSNIEDLRTLPEKKATLESLPDDLHPELLNSLKDMGIDSLYSHQLSSLNLLSQGENIAVVTGTASGKTLCYNIPIIDRLLKNPIKRALFLFPTKALSRDQSEALSSLVQSNDLPHGIYDGDIAQNKRPSIRKIARIVLSNPDMLHAGILPHHTNWIELFSNLEFVVVDEMHTYRGVFGSHVANVIRRLKRITSYYGSNPQFILTSATINNPSQLAEKLIEEKTKVIVDDGSPRGPKKLLIYNPPIIDKQLGLRKSSLKECIRLSTDIIDNDIQTIIFARSRRTVELLLTYLNDQYSQKQDHHNYPFTQEASVKIRGYRSGYLPKRRRSIEQGLRTGKIDAVVATNALELGIDIGELDAVVLVGYPGSIAAAWQQIGRAGRGTDLSLAVLITTPNPLDQFLAKHPDYIFQNNPESALIDPDNLLVLLGHMRCATFELPFQKGDQFGNVKNDQVLQLLEYLHSEGNLHSSKDRYFWMSDKYPAEDISLRNASAENVVLQVSNIDAEKQQEYNQDPQKPQTLGEVDKVSAHWLVHPRAVYIHEGSTYLVSNLDLNENIATLKPINLDYYTQPRSKTDVKLLEKLASEKIKNEMGVCASKSYGELKITSQLKGFQKIKWYTHERLGFGEVDLPPHDLNSFGYWLSLSEFTVNQLREEDLWRNDPIQYGNDWKNKRDKIRERDQFTCRVCGKPETNRTHDVHHIDPVRSFSSMKIANSMDNLITLCHQCHRIAETNVRIRSGLYGLTYLLSHLAPLYLMCEKQDLGVHIDPRSSIEKGLPTIIIYEQIPGGIGFSKHIYDISDTLILHASELVSTCHCFDGCPSCVGPGGENGLGSKRETSAILDMLVNA